jgi:hypothetical protein
MVPLVIHSDPNCRGVQRWINARGLLVQQATDGNRRGGPTFNRQVRWSTLQLFVERRSQAHNATSLAMASGICLMPPAVAQSPSTNGLKDPSAFSHNFRYGGSIARALSGGRQGHHEPALHELPSERRHPHAGRRYAPACAACHTRGWRDGSPWQYLQRLPYRQELHLGRARIVPQHPRPCTLGHGSRGNGMVGEIRRRGLPPTQGPQSQPGPYPRSSAGACRRR